MQKPEYTKEWIKKLRNGMRQDEFCRHIYVYKKNGSACCNIHRNTLGNWENGKTSLPRDVETFLSLALWEYDQFLCDKQNETDMTEECRNQRYQHARTRLQQMLHVDLYCRNVHDALLIQVARGILTFEEVPALEAELEKELAQTILTTEERNAYAIERNTISISSDLCRVGSREALVNLITVIHRNSFASANRIVGARLKNIYVARNRYPKPVSLERAITNLAPNYRNSYVRMFTSSFISREWLLDLCVHLHFDEAEVSAMLESAHMAALSPEEWKGLDDSNIYFRDKKLSERLKIMLVLGCYVREQGEMTAYLQAKHMLESFSIYEQGTAVITAFDQILQEKLETGRDLEELESDEIWTALDTSTAYRTWLSYVELEDVAISFDNQLWQFSNELCAEYDSLPEKRIVSCQDKTDVQLLYFFTAMSYSILLGRRFPGKLMDQDLLDLKKQFDMENGLQGFIYMFLSTLIGVFLGDEVMCETGDGKFFVFNKVKQENTRALDFDEILENIFQAVVALYENE